MASPFSQRIWREEDELCLLMRLVDFRSNKTKLGAKIDWDAFYNFVQGSFRGRFSMEQMFSKIRELKHKFLQDKKRIDGGNDPLFTRSSDSAIFGYAIMLWGQNEHNLPDHLEDNEGNVRVPNAVTVNDNDTEKSNVDDELASEVVGDKVVEENKTVGHYDADVLCAVLDAFEETMMSNGLSQYQKKLQVQKLMNLGAEKRKELSKEWEALGAEGTRLDVKKIKFSVKLAEAATD